MKEYKYRWNKTSQEAVDDFNEAKREFIEAVDNSLRESRLVKIMNKIVDWCMRSRRSRDGKDRT